MNYGFYLEILIGAVPDNYVIEDSDDRFLGTYLLLSITDKDKYYVSLYFETEENIISLTFMTDSTDPNKEYKEEYKDLKNINQYKIQEFQTKLKDIICSEMKTFINNQ
jgi:hypothetical protein